MLLARWRAALAEDGDRRGRPALLLADSDSQEEEDGRAPPRPISYGDLDAHSDALAATLRDQYGVGPRDRVGVDCLISEPAEIVALLALLKCQVIYAPLSRPHPWADRRARLLDAGARVLLTTNSTSSRADQEGEFVVLRLDPMTGGVVEASDAAAAAGPVVADSEERGLEGAFNLLYTSGSTGPPKGVIGREAGALYRLDWMLGAPGLALHTTTNQEQAPQTAAAVAPPQEVVLRRTPLTFVDSVWELWGALLAGVPLLLSPNGGLDTDPLALWAAALHPTHGATRLTLTPTLLSALLASHAPRLRSSRLRLLICSGEPLTWTLARQFLAAAPEGARLLSLYGSTEVSGDASFFLVSSSKEEGDGDDGDDDGLVPLGQPIPGTRLWVVLEGGEWVDAMDPPGQEAGDGLEGELVVEGPGVALGYYRREAETAAAFAFGDGSSSSPRFRTGDWVRIVVVGSQGRQLVFIGRRDGVVKVRGVRVGLVEAERRVAAALGIEGQQQQQIAMAVMEGGGGLLLALTAEAAAVMEGDGNVWRRLRGAVPPEMVPAKVVVGSDGASLPVTSSGKVDRRALLEWGVPMVWVGQEEEGDLDGDEEVVGWLEGCFAALLGEQAEGAATKGLGVFDRGGTSLLAMQALGAIEARFGVRLPLEELGRDVKGLAARVIVVQQQQQRRRKAAPSPIDPQALLSVAWRVDLGKCVDAAPLLARVPGVDADAWVAIAGSHSHVVAAVDAWTGRERWRTPVGGRVEGGAAVSRDGGLCLVGCYDGKLYALEVGTGVVAFVVPTGGEVKGTPLSLSLGGIALCVFGSYDGHAYIILEKDGTVVARVPLGGSPFASPVALPINGPEEGVARVVLATNRGRVLQLRLSLHANALGVEEEWAREAGCAVFTTPAIVLPSSSPLLVLGGTDGTLMALDNLNGGREAWRVDLKSGPVFCPPLPVCASMDVVVGAQDGAVRRLCGRTGAVVWVAEGEGNPAAVTSRPALVVGGGGELLVVVATAAGRLRLLDVGTGAAVGAAVGVGAGQRLGTPVVLEEEEGGGSMVVVGSRDNGVYGLRVGIGQGGTKRPRRGDNENVQ